MVRAETAVHKLEALKTELHEALAEPDLYEGDNAKLVELQKRFAETENGLVTAEEFWLGLQEQWERR